MNIKKFFILVLFIMVSLFTYGYFTEYRPYKQDHYPLSFKDMLIFMRHSCFTAAEKASKEEDALINESSGTSTTSPKFVYIDSETSPMGIYMKSSCGQFYRVSN